MNLSVSQIGRIFQTYRTQERIADLNRQSRVNTVQIQQDQVTLSTQAREFLENLNRRSPGSTIPPASAPAPQAPAPRAPARGLDFE